MKRFVSVIFLLFVLMTMVACSGFGGGPIGDGNGNYYEEDGIALQLVYEIIDENNATVVGYIENENATKIVVADTYDGVPVTSISDFAFLNSDIAYVTIPASVKKIGGAVFYGNDSDIIFLTYLGSLQSWYNIEIPDYWNGDKEISLSSTEENGDRYGINVLANELDESIVYEINDDKTFSIKWWASVTSPFIIIPETYFGVAVTKILPEAFKDNAFLEEVYVCGTVKSIGKSAFENCTSLSQITISYNIEVIEDKAFKNCSSIGYINFCDLTALKSIGEEAFMNCSNISGIDLRSCTELEAIGKSAFEACSSVSSLYVGESVKEIGERAFFDCQNLNYTDFKCQISEIKKDTFNGCTSLSDIYIPLSVTKIYKGAFDYCCSLTGLWYDGSQSDWEAVEKEVHWAYPMDRNIYFIIDENSYSCAEAGTVDISTSYEVYIIYNAEKGSVVLYSADVYGDNFLKIPESYYGYTIDEIPAECFKDMSTLYKVTMSNTITKIGERAFANCPRLSVISFNGTVEEWNNIDKGDDWFDSYYVEIYCTDGKLICGKNSV